MGLEQKLVNEEVLISNADKVIKGIKEGNYCLLERALLIALGCRPEEVKDYLKKINNIYGDYVFYKHRITKSKLLTELEIEALLFNYFYKDKPTIYNKSYLLTDVIDAQLSNNEEGVGDCLGLTTLFTIIGLREGLRLSLNNTPGHINNLLEYKGKKIVIENAVNYGFLNEELIKALPEELQEALKKFIIKCDEGVEEPVHSLITTAYHSRLCDAFVKKDYHKAIHLISNIIAFEPDNINLVYIRKILHHKVEDKFGAIEDGIILLTKDPDYRKSFIDLFNKSMKDPDCLTKKENELNEFIKDLDFK